MQYICIVLLTGISLAPFVFFKTDIWHAGGVWVQLMVMVAFSWSFFEKGKPIVIKNVPMGLLHLWVGSYVALLSYITLLEGSYNVRNFFPYFNFLTLLILYRIIIQYLNISQINLILKSMRWVIIATLFMAVLQRFNASQFFQLVNPEIHETSSFKDNLVVGFIGNGTHLSGFLACSIPLFLIRKTREDILALVLMFFVLFYCGTSRNDPSISGFVIGFAILMWYLLRRNRKWFVLSLSMVVLAGITILFLKEGFVDKLFASHGRLEIWAYYFKVLKSKMPVTGLGLGRINQFYNTTPYPNARHLHLEYLHFAFEIGFVGLALIVNVIVDFFRKKEIYKTQFILKLMVFGFLLSCCFNFPAHLWLPSTWTLFAYAAYIAIENQEKINGNIIKGRD